MQVTAHSEKPLYSAPVTYLNSVFYQLLTDSSQRYVFTSFSQTNVQCDGQSCSTIYTGDSSYTVNLQVAVREGGGYLDTIVCWKPPPVKAVFGGPTAPAIDELVEDETTIAADHKTSDFDSSPTALMTLEHEVLELLPA